MNTQLNKPKGFGEILDFTFQLARKRFTDFFLILLLLVGPIYLIEALILLIGGTSFFRESLSEGYWFEQFLTQLENTGTIESGSIGLTIGYFIVMLIGFLFYPVAQAAIIIMIDQMRKNEEVTVGTAIKRAFTRFWPLLGSNLLFGLILVGIVFIPIILLSLVSGVLFFIVPIVGILLMIPLFLGLGVGYLFLMTKWSFYFGSVTLKEGTPGLGRSWRLTRKQTWKLVGLYVIFLLIIMCVSNAVQITATLLLGNSVLQSIIVNLVTLVTTVIFSVGYAVMYLDLKIRHDADDLKDLLDEY
ncbi:hypothetical protein [Metabacillus malikii]|uniref:DUF7847 domain-containing protein n=1 Tax=Metabacillus malikii TaxID=1504265 RepID=A0ABT9ZFU2_9BACI|nr:hypothetical protein [Metabacillus malikii]MDQ0231143.1 hypothetical protein [Metabacillus malikii]